MTGERSPWIVAAMSGVLVAACVMSSTCPCGQVYDQDPNDPTSPFYVGQDHVEADHCFCRCGPDPEQRLPPSESCDGYEGACTQRDGAIGRLRCE